MQVVVRVALCKFLKVKDLMQRSNKLLNALFSCTSSSNLLYSPPLRNNSSIILAVLSGLGVQCGMTCG